MSIRRLTARPMRALDIAASDKAFQIRVRVRTSTMELSSNDLLVPATEELEFGMLSELIAARDELEQVKSLTPRFPKEPVRPHLSSVRTSSGSERLSEHSLALLDEYHKEFVARAAEVERIQTEQAHKVREADDRLTLILLKIGKLTTVTILFSQPLMVARIDRGDDRSFALYRDQLWASFLELTGEQWAGLVDQSLAREKKRLDSIVQRNDNTRVRTAITVALRHAVWKRDGGRCVVCGSREKLEFDHIIPISQGGSTTERNLELLCEICNRAKACSLG